MLIALAQVPAVRRRATAECDAFLADLLHRYSSFDNLSVADRDGDVFCSGVPRTGPVNLADREYFRRALETGNLAVSDFLVARITGRPGFALAHPVLDDAGEVQGAVCEEAALSLDVPVAVVMLHDPARDVLCPAAGVGLPPEQWLPPVPRADYGEWIALQTTTAREGLTVPGAVGAVPLLAKGQVKGVLEAFSRSALPGRGLGGVLGYPGDAGGHRGGEQLPV